MNLLIHNVLIFTNGASESVLKGNVVAIENNHIRAVGLESELETKYAHFTKLDGGGRLLMPGLINTHMHFYGTFARGLALPLPPANFAEILSMLWWKLDSALDLDSVHYSALVPAISAVKNGVTAVIDHHASPRAISGSLDRIEEALDLVGLRGVLCYEVSDRDGPEISKQGLDENERYLQKCQAARRSSPGHLFDGMVGLHASFTLDNETLKHAANLSRKYDRGCHIHLLEDAVDRTETQTKYGMGVVDRMLEYGILGSRTIAAHGIYLRDPEIESLAKTDTMVVHNAQSNMNNAVGRADVFKLLKNGILTGIGTDGMSADLRPDIRAADLLHKHDLRDSNAGWMELQQMALRNNPKIFERVSGQKIGKIEPGYLADLILLDYFPPTPITSENFWGHFLFGIVDAPVDTSIINGRIVMRGKVVIGVDEARVAEKASACAENVWEKFYSEEV